MFSQGILSSSSSEVCGLSDSLGSSRDGCLQGFDLSTAPSAETAESSWKPRTVSPNLWAQRALNDSEDFLERGNVDDSVDWERDSLGDDVTYSAFVLDLRSNIFGRGYVEKSKMLRFELTFDSALEV